jgi:hypothetical protein
LLALHCFWFGVHARHCPMLHGVVPQLVMSFQWPVASHDCTVLPEHRFAVPGAHSPPQSFVVVSHTKVQAVDAPHAPLAPHVSTRFVEPAAQRVALGLHMPVHSPAPVHALAHAVCIWLVPVASHRNGVLFAPQVRVPGTHDPVHIVAVPVPPQANGHVAVSCQSPCKSHCWMTEAPGLHRFVPAMQRDAHRPVPSSHTMSPWQGA